MPLGKGLRRRASYMCKNWKVASKEGGSGDTVELHVSRVQYMEIIGPLLSLTVPAIYIKLRGVIHSSEGGFPTF